MNQNQSTGADHLHGQFEFGPDVLFRVNRIKQRRLIALTSVDAVRNPSIDPVVRCSMQFRSRSASRPIGPDDLRLDTDRA